MVSVADVTALITELGHRMMEALKSSFDCGTWFDCDISIHVSSDVEQTLQRLEYEVNTIVAIGDYPKDGWKGPSAGGS